MPDGEDLTPLARRALLGGALALPAAARAGARPRITIGVLTDMAGPFAAIGGAGSVACARQAAREFGAAGAFDVEVIAADHGNDPARGASVASAWYERGVSLILDVPNSDVALAVAGVAAARNRAYVNCGAGTTKLTGEACNAQTIHWSFDTWMLAQSTGGAFVHNGSSTWFLIAADYEFGRQLRDDLRARVTAAGGRLEGTDMYPFGRTRDFSAELQDARASGAAVLALCNAGDEMTSAIRQANEAGIPAQMHLACMLLSIGDVHRLGLVEAGHLLLTETFYWDLNARTRAFAARLPEFRAFRPGMAQAGCYAAARHFLATLAEAGPALAADGAAIVARMKARPTEDDAFGAGHIRADGRALFPAFLFRVKTEAESGGAWDYYTPVSVTSALAAARPVGEGGCARAARS